MSKEHKAQASAKDLPPPFRLVLKDGSQHDFWGYDKLYTWCKDDKSRERWLGLILSSAFVLLFGEAPLRFVDTAHFDTPSPGWNMEACMN